MLKVVFVLYFFGEPQGKEATPSLLTLYKKRVSCDSPHRTTLDTWRRGFYPQNEAFTDAKGGKLQESVTGSKKRKEIK